MAFGKRSRGGKSERVSPPIADIRHYFCMRQSCNFHHRGDFTSPDTANAGCVRLCNGKQWKHSPLRGLCVSGDFCFGSISLEKHICTFSSSSTVGGGGRTSWFCKAMIHNRKGHWLGCIFVELLLHCCASAWIFLLQPRFHPSHKLCIPELISSQWPQHEYGSVPPRCCTSAGCREYKYSSFFIFISYVWL